MSSPPLLGWRLTPTVRLLLVAMAAVWIVEVLLVQWLAVPEPITLLALTPDEVLDGSVWQLLTYMWLHAPDDFWHIVLNGLFLWMFGGSLELAWGRRAFLRFYLLCGFGAGLVVLVTGLVFEPRTAVLGASGAIYGLVAAWALTFPNQVVWLFGLVPMRGKHFALIPIGLAALDFFTRASSGVSHSAHLGGLAVGALLVTGFWRPGRILDRLRRAQARRHLRVIDGSAKRPPPDGGYWH